MKNKLALEKSGDKLYAFFDFAACPPTFDFINFICMVECARKVAGYRSFEVVFLPGPADGFRTKTFYTPEHQHYRVQNVLFPAMALGPNCSGFHYIRSRSDGRIIAEKAGSDVFPWGYNIDQPVGYYNWGASVEMLRQGHRLPALSAGSVARAKAKKWLQEHCDDRKPIIITLRESPYEPKRNSNLKAWREFIDSLGDEYCAVIIRDHETSLDELPQELESVLICREAPWNLEFRAALYELAYIAFFVNNGPWLLGILNPNVNCVIMNLIVEDHSVSATKWFRQMGMLPDQLSPFWGPTQSLVWKPDNLDNIQDAFGMITRNIEDLFRKNFDPDWYLLTYPEARDEIFQENLLGPLEHYKLYSRTRKLSPNKFFNESGYRLNVDGANERVELGVIRNGFEEHLKLRQLHTLVLEH